MPAVGLVCLVLTTSNVHAATLTPKQPCNEFKTILSSPPHNQTNKPNPRNLYKQEYRQRRAAQERDKQAAATADFNKLFDGAGLSMGELPPGIDITK